MATKTITITEDAYEILRRHKVKDESFSEVIKREFAKKGDIMKFAGAWSHLSDKEISEIKKNIKDTKRRFTKEILERSKRFK